MSKSKKLTKPTADSIVSAIVMIVIGILFCIFRGESMGIAFWIIGAIILVGGIFNVVSGRTVLGIIMIVIGALTCFGGLGGILLMIMTILLGVSLIVRGAYSIVGFGSTKNFLGFVLGILTIAIGVLLIVNNWVGQDIIAIILGVSFMVDGLVTLFYNGK